MLFTLGRVWQRIYTSDTCLSPRIAGPLIRYFKLQNCIVIHKCTSVRHAKVRPMTPYQCSIWKLIQYLGSISQPNVWAWIYLVLMVLNVRRWFVTPTYCVFTLCRRRWASWRRRYRRSGASMRFFGCFCLMSLLNYVSKACTCCSRTQYSIHCLWWICGRTRVSCCISIRLFSMCRLIAAILFVSFWRAPYI